MPALDQLFAKSDRPAFGNAQCWQAEVVSVNGNGIFVVIPSYDRNLRWGPCEPATATVEVGDRLSVTMDEVGQLWLVGAGAAGGGGGDPGPPGPTGPTGATGATGPAGPKGDKGDTGTTGSTGLQGPTGAPGSAGSTGPAGADGKTVRSGTGAPAGGLGVAGDFYIDTAAWTIYGPKTTVWGSATSIVGPQGPTGPTGSTGAQGPQGVKGDTGATGATGPPGAGPFIYSQMHP